MTDIDIHLMADTIDEDYHSVLKDWWIMRRKKKVACASPYRCLVDFMEEGGSWTVTSLLAAMKDEIKEFKNEEVQEILDIL